MPVWAHAHVAHALISALAVMQQLLTIDLQYVTGAERHEKVVKEYLGWNSIEDNYCFLLLLFIIHVWAQSNHAKQLFISTSNFTIVDIVHIM